jgi:hypothetical protein
MSRKKIIQIQAFVAEPIGVISNQARLTVSAICLGIDDMQLLGNKALVLRAEIFPTKLPDLYAALESIGIKVNNHCPVEIETLEEKTEYPLSIQITSYSDDTDRRAYIASVPG